MGEYVYRAQNEYINGTSIECKNRKSKRSVSFHIRKGTDVKTRFISTTGRISIAKYKYSRGKDEIPKRTPIVLIDFEKLKELKDAKEIYDFRDKSTRDETIEDAARNFARADREVTIEEYIPAECCKKIPPLMVDILSELEVEGPMEVLINPINDMIMNDSIEGIIDEILEEIEFNDLERNFIKEYYSDRMPTIQEMGDKLFPDIERNDLIAQCLKVEVLKKIFCSDKFKEFLKSKIPEKCSPELERTVTRLKEKFAEGIKLDERLLLYEISSRNKISVQGNKAINKMDRYDMGSSGLFVVFKVGYETERPLGMEYDYDKEGNVEVVKAQYYIIRKEKGEKPKESSCPQEIRLQVNREILPAKQIGELSLKGTDGKSLAAVAERESFGLKKIEDADKQKEKNEGLFK